MKQGVNAIVEVLDKSTIASIMMISVTERTRVVFVANPNNPTGTYSSRAEIARLHAGLRPDILLVLDQAYAEYLDAGEIGRAHV